MAYWIQKLTGFGTAFVTLFLLIYWLNGGVIGPLERVIENQNRIQRSLAIMCEHELGDVGYRCEELEAYNEDVLRRKE